MSGTDERRTGPGEPPAATLPPAPSRPRPPGPPRILVGVILSFLVGAIVLGTLFAAGFFGASPPTSELPPTPTPLGQLVPITPRPTPSAPASQPSATPDLLPVPGSPSVPPTPAGPEERLLGHVPPHLRSSCELGPGTPPALAIASCQSDDGLILVTYFLYGSARGMESAYDDFAASSRVERNSGRCSEPDTWPSEGTYRVAGEPAGRVLCMEAAGSPTIYWTDTRLRILSWAVHLENDADRLYEFWELEAGPSL